MKCPYCGERIYDDQAYICNHCCSIIEKNIVKFIADYLPEGSTKFELSFTLSELKKRIPFESYGTVSDLKYEATQLFIENFLQNIFLFFSFVHQLKGQGLEDDLLKELIESAKNSMENGTIKEFLKYCPYAGELSSTL